MIKRGNPLGIQATGQVTVNLEEQIKDLHQRIRSAEEDRHTWVAKQRILVEQRRGIRPKKQIPWVGANNDSVPLTDGTMRKWKPNIVSLITDSDPVAYFEATKADDVEDARTAQAFYDWKFRRIPGMLKTANALADFIGQHGIAYTRQGWRYKTDRRCRVIRVERLFPGGIEQSTDVANQAIREANIQLEQAKADGAVPDAVQPQAEFEVIDYVRFVLRQQYDIDENDATELGMSLERAVMGIMNGAEYVNLYYEVIVDDRPDWQAINPLDVIEPIRGRGDDTPDFIGMVHRMSMDDIRRMVKDGYFRPDEAERVISRMASRKQSAHDLEATTFDGRSASARSQLVDALNQLEGVHPETSFEFPYEPIWEVYCKLDINGDGILERVVLWYHPETATVLSLIEYPMPFTEWPIVKFEFEVTETRRPYQSRGMAELLSTFQKLTNKLHNSRLDAVQVLLSPMLKVRQSNEALKRNIRYRPGTVIPLQDVNDLQPLIQDFRGLSHFIFEENKTRADAEQYIGVFDSSVLQSQRSERRTATEVEAITNQISQILAGDAGLFQESMAMVHRQLWQLWLDFGPDQEYFRVIGEEIPEQITKEEINKEFDITPAGTPANTNKALALARARELMQVFAPDQTGLIDKERLYRYYIELLDRKLAKQAVRSFEDAAIVQQMAQLVAAAGQQPAPLP